MDKIKLTDNAKRILMALSKGENLKITDDDEKDLLLLEEEGLVDPNWTCDGPYPEITDRGSTYVYTNPKLKNPSIWDDKKYWITTMIAFVALGLSIYATFFK